MAKDKRQPTEGAWVFVSHSHRDLEKVREIRNYLESKGRNPLLFFLKCLSDDDARLPELIRDEIEARDWFILCDSLNAKASKYVAREIEIVKQMHGEVSATIDLNQPLEPQFYKLDELFRRATVFLSFARQDREVADRIQTVLLRHDYQVWRDSEIKPGESFANVIQSAIDDAVKRGFVLVLLSPASLTSQWCKHETEYGLRLAAQSHKSNVIPVVIAPLEREGVPLSLQLQLGDIQWFDLTTGPLEERVEELIRSLKTREME